MKKTRAISNVITGIVVTTILLGVVSVSVTSLLLLQQSAGEAIRREQEKAMESFFRIYWVNATHVALFNNHSSVDLSLKFWISSDAAVNVFPLNAADYSVAPGQIKIVKAADPPRTHGKLYKVVSERGSVFVVGDPPSEVYSLFKLLSSEKLVRPGFSSSLHGPLTVMLLGTGPEFGGGPVTLSCVSVFPSPASCSGWSISFNPSSPISVSAGGATTVNVQANVPAGTPLGDYFVRLKADTGGFSKEFLLRVAVGDFDLTIQPDSAVIRWGCATNFEVNVIPTNYRGTVSLKVVKVVDGTGGAAVNFVFSPNPVDLTHGITSSTLMMYANYGNPVTYAITVEAFDGLGPAKTADIKIAVEKRPNHEDPC